MPYIRGHAESFEDVISQVITWATDTNIHGSDAWELMRNEPWPRGTILKAHGWEEGEHFYIGLMPHQVEVGKTYANWFMQKSILSTGFVWAKEGLNLAPNTYFTTSGLQVTIPKEKGSYVANFVKTPEIFFKNAKIMYGGVFKQYAEGLEWHEQAGGITLDKIGVMPLQYIVTDTQYAAPSYPTVLQMPNPPIYPGVGYPAIGMDITGPLDGILEYWIVKDAHRMTIVVRNRGYWDVLHLGFLEPYAIQSQYPFPAVAIGGTSGAVATCVLSAQTAGGYYEAPTITGILFDYRPSNWSLTHSIPPFASIPFDDKNSISNANIMLPDGRWQTFANWVQGVTVEITRDYRGYLTNRYFLRNKPARTHVLQHYIRPGCSDLNTTQHVYDPAGVGITYQMEPIEFVDATADSPSLLGKLWGMYWPSMRVAQYGESIINDKKYLVLPNSWEGRRWHIMNNFTTTSDYDLLLQQELEIEIMSQQMNCVITLEE
jgi:hypothetical protein